MGLGKEILSRKRLIAHPTSRAKTAFRERCQVEGRGNNYDTTWWSKGHEWRTGETEHGKNKGCGGELEEMRGRTVR